jgi:peptidoglycan/xylan/chitin deacetylase (PgdA/CDA1 family)
MATVDLGIPILLYHKIGRPPRGARVPGQYVAPGLFRKHLDYLAGRGYRTISLLELAGTWSPDRRLREASPGEGEVGRSAERPLVITFDDGYRCLHEHAFPALVERGMTATVFLVVGALGGSNVWEQAIGDVAEPMLTLGEIREMRAHGIEFGSHTLSHAHLAQLAEPEAEREIAQSRTLFEEKLGEACRSFAYPYGEWNARVKSLVMKAGYEVACTTLRASVRRGDDPLALPRINIRRYNVVPRFAYKLWRAEQSRR